MKSKSGNRVLKGVVGTLEVITGSIVCGVNTVGKWATAEDYGGYKEDAGFGIEMVKDGARNIRYAFTGKENEDSMF